MKTFSDYPMTPPVQARNVKTVWNEHTGKIETYNPDIHKMDNDELLYPYKWVDISDRWQAPSIRGQEPIYPPESPDSDMVKHVSPVPYPTITCETLYWLLTSTGSYLGCVKGKDGALTVIAEPVNADPGSKWVQIREKL